MTYEEACEAWKNHSPWIRASKELIAAIQQRTKQEERADDFQRMLEEAGESK
jgi:hypothetical protein